MQKRIKFDQILKEKNEGYAEIWRNLLDSINQSSPIFYLESFGVIAFIDKSLYLLLGDEVLQNHVVVDQMINLQEYFIRPDCYRLNFRPLSKIERYVVQFFISYLKQSINTNHYIYLLVIDFQKLGKLVISKSIIEYFNGKHHWKYQATKKIVELPSLLQSRFQYSNNQQKIANKISLSVKKFASLSLKKDESKPEGKLKRTNSAARLHNVFNKNLSNQQKISLDNNRVVTESYEKRAKSKSKIQLQKIRVYQKEKLQIKGQVEKSIKTEPSKQQQRQNQDFSRRIISRERVGTSKSRKQIRTEQGDKKIKMQIKPQKRKLTLAEKPKLRIPSERQRLILQDEQHQNVKVMIMEFVYRSSMHIIEGTSLKYVPPQKIKSFLQEIAHIYMQSEEQVKKDRLQKRRLLIEEQKIIKKKSIIEPFDHGRLEQFICAREEDYNIFHHVYDLIEEWKIVFKHQLSSYIVSYQEHQKLISWITNKFTESIQISKVSHRTKIQIALLLHELYKFIQDLQIELLKSIMNKAKKLIYISIQKETSFQMDVMDFVQTFQNMCSPLIKYLQNNFEKLLWIQPHQIEDLKSAKSSLHSFIIGYSPLVLQNFAKFRTVNCKSILNATYHTQKQGLTLIKKLDTLKYSLENESEFKSQLLFEGIFMNCSLIKQQYLMIINQKYHDIYAYFLKVYEKSEGELNNKLKTIIVINVDYLSDYKCRQYRQEIEEHYKNLLQSLMLLMNHFYYLFKESEINHYLNVAYEFKIQIQHNLNNFYNKLQEYRNNSNKTIKMLEVENKKNKEVYQQLTQKLKKLLINLVNQRSILEMKAEILKLESDFQVYNASNKKLMQSMKDNEMVYWEDDQFFSTNINLLKSSLDFLQGKNFKIFFNTPIGELTINQFYSAFQEFSNFINLLVDTKMEKLFKPTFTLIQNNLVLAEILLYKQYTQFQLQKSKEFGIDIGAERSSKIYMTIKRYQNFQKKKFEKVVQLYRNSRLNEFNLYHDEGINCIKLQKERGELDIEYISNIEEVKQFLQQHNSIKSFLLLERLEQLIGLFKQILQFNKMIYLISEATLPDNLKQSLLQEYNQQYEKILNLNIPPAQIQKFKNKLFDQKIKYMQLFYHEKVNIFNRYALCSIDQLISLDEWKNNQNIIRNIRYIFENVDDVTFDSDGNILTYVVAKDTLTFDKPYNIFEKEGEIAKSIYIHTENFLRNSVSHSEFACIYIKILIWQIYFTQQVELSLMTESSLAKVKAYFLQIIQEIANQIRYDMKLHHKSYEIAQLNFFINHIQKIKDMHSITDFEWVSTVRFYQKLRIVKVEQNQRVHDYSFEIKKPLNYDPSFQLESNISYGFKESSIYYQMSAYILGKPYATFQSLKDYGFQINYTVLMNLIKKFEYYIRIMVKAQNFKSINYFHKKILEFSLKKLGSLQQQTLSMPILFQYQSQSALPPCFPQKYRNFSNPQFFFDLNLIILLQLNKHQQIIEKSRINIQILIKVLNIINIKKNLTMKKAVSFVEDLSKYLQQRPQKQQIYKFCYKYFIVNYQVDDHQLSMILKELIKDKDNDLSSITQSKVQVIEQFIKSDKFQLIMYGPSSQKTYSIKSLKIPSFYEYDTLDATQTYFIEGIEEFLSCKKQLGKYEKIKFIVEDRYIYHIQPSLIVDAILHYTRQLSVSNVQSIFKNKILQLKLEGNYERLWDKLISFYNVLTQIISQTSFVSLTELVLRCYESHIKQFLNELEPQEREYYKLTINKETIRTFMVITHQIFYYMLSQEERKKFNEKIRNLSFMDEYRCEELQSMTCKGLNCQKLLNLIKKEKVTFKNIGNFTKQFILIKKYLKYQEPIAIYSTSKVTLKLLKQQIENLDYNKIQITLHDKFVDILRISKYKNILYIINDLHLEAKPKLTFLKARQELPSNNLSYYLMLTSNHSYRKVMKHYIAFKFSDIEIEEVYKFQTKQGIVDQTQVNCRKFWSNGFFIDQITFLMFLINISVKLPSQYFKKYFARQLIFSKLTPDALAITTIAQNQEFIKKVADISSANAFLIDFKGHHQEITQTQAFKKIEKTMGSCSFVQKIIIKQYYKQLIPYALADKIYIIKEQLIILPFLITAIHERKHFILKNLNFVPQLIQVIQQIYVNQRECTLIIEEPLTSSKQWQQFLSNYLKGIDLINLYSELRQYTQLLANKEQYVYRLDDQSIPLKDKVNQIIYSKIKIIISQTVKSTLLIPSHQLYVNNIIYLNCSLTVSHKKHIAQNILKKIMAQSSQEVNEVLLKFKVFLLQLIDSNLLFLNRMELFLNDIISTVKTQLEELVRFKEAMLHKKKLFSNLNLIREGIDRQFTEVSFKQKENKLFLNKILKVIDGFEKQTFESTEDKYYENLIKARDEFTTNQQKTSVWIKQNPEFGAICQSLSKLFPNSIKIEYGIALFQLTPQYFALVLTNEQFRKNLEETYNKYENNQLINSFILIRYVKFILSLCQIYKTLESSPSLINKQVKQLNYYYLLDVCIELKAKETVILEQFEDLKHRKRLIEKFINILISVEHINFEQSDLINYHIFNRIKKTIRSYAIESGGDYPLLQILSTYDARFLSIAFNFEEYLLRESEMSFENYNKSMLLQRLKLIIYDPYNKIQQLCHELSIKIIYVNSEHDIQQLYDYKFKMTIFCIKLKNLESYYNNRKLIQNSIDIIIKKHTDLKQNILEKLVISIDEKEILSQIKQQYSVINLGYNFIKFTQEIQGKILNDKQKWKQKRQHYVDIKKKLRKQIELIKTLNPEEISLYIIKLEGIINMFQERHQQISSISSGTIFKQSHYGSLESIFKLIIRLHNKYEFPMNLSLRLLKNVNIMQVISKWETGLSGNMKQQQDWFKNTLLLNRSQNIIEEIQDCIAQSRYVAIIYEQFNKKVIKDVLQIQDTKKYVIRTIIEINDEQLKQFQNLTSFVLDTSQTKQIILLFVKFYQIRKLKTIINKCSVLWI